MNTERWEHREKWPNTGRRVRRDLLKKLYGREILVTEFSTLSLHLWIQEISWSIKSTILNLVGRHPWLWNRNIWHSNVDFSRRAIPSSYLGSQLNPSAASPDSKTLWETKLQDHSLKIECASGVDCCFGLIRTCCFLNSYNFTWWIVLVTCSVVFEHVAFIRGNDSLFPLWKASFAA